MEVCGQKIIQIWKKTIAGHCTQAKRTMKFGYQRFVQNGQCITQTPLKVLNFSTCSVPVDGTKSYASGKAVDGSKPGLSRVDVEAGLPESSDGRWDSVSVPNAGSVLESSSIGATGSVTVKSSWQIGQVVDMYLLAFASCTTPVILV